MEVLPSDGRPGGEGGPLTGDAHGADVGGRQVSCMDTVSDYLTNLKNIGRGKEFDNLKIPFIVLEIIHHQLCLVTD